jgi:hypothetical protein
LVLIGDKKQPLKQNASKHSSFHGKQSSHQVENTLSAFLSHKNFKPQRAKLLMASLSCQTRVQTMSISKHAAPIKQLVYFKVFAFRQFFSAMGYEKNRFLPKDF